MAKTKAAEAPAPTIPETPPSAAPAEKPTQRVAVQQALAAGMDSPADGVKFVKDKFDIQLNNQSFSTIKSQIKKAGDTVKSAGKRGRPAGSVNASANGAVAHKPASALTTTGGTNPAALAMAVKELVAAHGAETVKAMADVFAK
jgi:hypothetical protein